MVNLSLCLDVCRLFKSAHFSRENKENPSLFLHGTVHIVLGSLELLLEKECFISGLVEVPFVSCSSTGGEQNLPPFRPFSQSF